MSTHPGNKLKIGVFVIGCVIQLSASNQLFAQRQIPFDNMQFKPCSPHYVQPVLNAPPITSDMPYDVIRSYVVIDSLCKIEISCEEVYRTVSDSLSISQVETLLKYLYVLLDYDPVLFQNYIKFGYYLNERYKNSPECFYNALRKIAFEKMGATPVFMLAFADGIYEIEVTSVAVDSAFTGFQRYSTDNLDAQTCISARVNDVIKGGSLLTVCNDDGDGGTTGGGYLCSRFSYGNGWFTYFGPSGGSDVRTIIEYIDSTGNTKIISPLYSVVHQPHIGDTYLVFLQASCSPALDVNGAPVNVYPFRLAQWEGGLFPVVQGKLSDSGNYFGLGKSPDLDEVKSFLRTTIDSTLQP